MAEGFIREFDFLLSLPPEVVLKITEYLDVHDVLRCMTVCRGWNEMLTLREFAPFWRRVCRYIGLPEPYIRTHMPNCRFPNDLFLEARNHKLTHVPSIKPELKALVGIHPFESTTKCEYAGDGYFVKTVDFCSLENEETVIGELCTERRVVKKLDSLVGSYGEVYWASLCAENIIWTTSKGLWFRYDLNNASFSRLFDFRVTRSMGDTIGHCKHCHFLVVAGTENTMHGYSWNLHFLKIEEGRGQPLEKKLKVQIPPGITQFIPRPVKAYILPDDDLCQRHRLLIQGGTGACMFALEHSLTDGITLSSKPIGTLNPFFDCEAAVMVVNTTSEITLSSDEQLMGLVTSVVYPFQSGLCLHIFKVSTYERIISLRVDWKEDFNDAEVLALSGLYAVLGIGHSYGAVKIVHCRTGKVLLEHYGLSRGLPPVIPMARLLLVHYQGVFNEDCLFDVHGQLTLVVMYRKGIGNIEGVFFAPFPKLESSVKGSLKDLDDSEDADEEM